MADLVWVLHGLTDFVSVLSVTDGRVMESSFLMVMVSDFPFSAVHFVSCTLHLFSGTYTSIILLFSFYIAIFSCYIDTLLLLNVPFCGTIPCQKVHLDYSYQHIPSQFLMPIVCMVYVVHSFTACVFVLGFVWVKHIFCSCYFIPSANSWLSIGVSSTCI